MVNYGLPVPESTKKLLLITQFLIKKNLTVVILFKGLQISLPVIRFNSSAEFV